MKQFILTIYRLFILFGFDPRRTIQSIRGLPHYFRDLQQIKTQVKNSEREIPFKNPYLCLGDRFKESGSTSGHYFHQDLLVANRIFLNTPEKHVDIGSRVDGFVAHVASFRPIEVIDIRTSSNRIPNISFIQADIMTPVSDDLVSYCDSLSCLHALEHFGLGRYGDPINYDGYLLGLANIYQILKKDGKFYFSVPIGPQRIEFNAHRVFSISYLLECLQGKFSFDQFSYVDDQGAFHQDVLLTSENIQTNFNCYYGCGIFEMIKM